MERGVAIKKEYEFSSIDNNRPNDIIGEYY